MPKSIIKNTRDNCKRRALLNSFVALNTTDLLIPHYIDDTAFARKISSGHSSYLCLANFPKAHETLISAESRLEK